MKKLIPLLLLVASALTAVAQTATFTLTTAPCHNDGVLTANFTGLTPPLTVTWTTFGLAGGAIVHTGVAGLSDALSLYSGGELYVTATDGSATASSYYSGAPPFTFTTASTPAICPALGTETATVTGGTAPYSYQWFNSSTMASVGTTNPISLPAGLYGVTITDAHGCVYGSLVSMDSTTGIDYVSSIAVPLTTTAAGCTNGTASTGAISGGVPPYTYLWSNGATSPSISSLIMGSYSVVVTDAAGCYGTGYGYVSQTITISVPVTPTPATCLASDGGVIGFGSGGVSPYTYLWSNGATTQSQSGLTSGYYSVTATDANGCIGTGGGSVAASTPISVSYSATASSCTSPTGSAHLTVSGGTTPYSISWYTTPPQTGVSATALAPGNYGFHVTDAVGCVQSGTAHVPPVDIISAYFTSTSALCTSATGGLTIVPSGGATPYTYSWSTGGATASITGLHAGDYNVTVTDHNGCQIFKTGFVPDYSPVHTGITATPASCIFTADGSLNGAAFGGTAPYSYHWSNGGSTSAISSLSYGPYWLYVTDASGCAADDYAYLGYNHAGTSCYCTISGTIYYDVNNNCVQDAGENGIPDIQVYCSGIGYTYTDASGHYSFIVPTGSYTITETIRAFYPLSSCQLNNIPVSVTASSGCTHTVDFANAIDPIHDMHISTWDYSMPVPGNTYRQVAIISNNGTVAETAVYAGYKTDGQLLAPSFLPSAIFTGSPYLYYTTSSFPTLNPGHRQAIFMDYSVPTTIPLSTTVVFQDSVVNAAPMSNWLTDYSPWNNVNYFTTYTVGSYDPNFTEVSPKGLGAPGTITRNDSVLEYMVHFQNTGTAPAENVVVIDTLDNNLDWTSLIPTYQSAQCKVTLTQSGTVKIAKFTFEDINLPAQASNPITSNAMFTYTIKQLPHLPLGTRIRAHASIYFDYNAPVITDTTLNTIGAVTATPTVTAQGGYNTFTVYPNPASRSFSALIDAQDAGSAEMRIANVTGKVVISKPLTLQAGSQAITCDVSGLTPGIYFTSLLQNGQTQTQKLVIMK